MDPGKVGGLVSAAADGDAGAWRALVENFSGLIWSVARASGLSHADAADVLQTTWLRMAEHLDRIENPQRVGAWLATTARHESLRLRWAGQRVLPTEDDLLISADWAAEDEPVQALLDAERAAQEKRRDRQLWAVFGQLPARCQELLRILIASPPPSYADVAAVLGIPVGSIGPTRARCLRRLRESLEQLGISSHLAGS